MGNKFEFVWNLGFGIWNFLLFAPLRVTSRLKLEVLPGVGYYFFFLRLMI
jgi:hypothetical protein